MAAVGIVKFMSDKFKVQRISTLCITYFTIIIMIIIITMFTGTV